MNEDQNLEHEAREQEAVRRIEHDRKEREQWDEESRARDAFQIRFPGGGIFVPNEYSSGIRPHLKWLVWALSLGGLVIMVLYGVSLVMS